MNHLENNPSQQNAMEQLVQKQMADLTKAIRMGNIRDRNSAMEKLLATDEGKGAIEKFLADNDPKKHSNDMGGPEYMKAAHLTTEVNRAMAHFIPTHNVYSVIQHRNKSTEQLPQTR